MRRLAATLFAVVFFACPALAQDFVLGLIPELNVFKQVERHRPLAAYLSSRMGVEVKLKMLSRYGNILDSFSEGRMDAAFWGSFTGAMALEKLGVVPVARPVELDGTSTYTGLVFVRKDSGIKSMGQLKGRSFAFVDRATTAGFLFPLALLRAQGNVDFSTYFSSHFFSGSHDAAILGVLNGDAAGGAAKNTIFKLLLKERPQVGNALSVIAESEPVPSNALGVRRDLDPVLITKLREVLLSMDNDTEGRLVLADFGYSRFIVTSAEDYKPVFEMARKGGVNLRDYNYVNK